MRKRLIYHKTFLQKLHLFLFIFILSFLIIFNPKFSKASPNKKAVLLVIDYLTLEDLDTIAKVELKGLVEEGLFGLMNTRTKATRTAPHTYASISGLGNLSGGSGSILALETDELIDGEEGKNIFQRYTGYLMGDGEIAILNWPQILNSAIIPTRKNDKVSGFLGDLLNEAGKKTAILGNSDTRIALNRPGALLTTDRHGLTPYGRVGKELLRPSTGLLSLTTNYDMLLQESIKMLNIADFLVIELGDLVRLESNKNFALKNIVKSERELILSKISNFIDKFLKEIDLNHTMVVIASPTPKPSTVLVENYLTPLIVLNEQIGSGFVYSNSTRREGLVTNTDLSATILDFLGLPFQKLIGGNPIVKAASNEEMKLDKLLNFRDKLIFINLLRPILLKPYIVLQIITIISSFILFFTLSDIIPYFKYWLSLLVAYPVTLLLMPVFKINNSLFYITVSIILTTILAVIGHLFAKKSPIKPFIFLGFLTAALITLDLVYGSFLIKHSVLGYDAIIGARYYGIGNEYMGVLIGSSFLCLSSIIEFNKSKLLYCFSVLFFPLVIWLMFSNSYGANFGGTFAFLIAFTFWFYHRFKVIINKKKWLFIGLFLVFFIALLLGGLNPFATESHIGKAFALAKKREYQELYFILIRKINMNLKLIRSTNWSRVFILALLASAFLFFKPKGFIQSLQKEHYPLFKAFTAILIGCLAALMLNDSGIVAASTAMIFFIYPLLSIAITKK